MRSLPATINNCKGKIEGKCSLLSALTSLMGLFTMLGNNTSWSGWARFINVKSSLLFKGSLLPAALPFSCGHVTVVSCPLFPVEQRC